MKLNLGCGNNYYLDYINVDNNPNVKKIDILCDLNKLPYPFKDNSIKEILMDHAIEHLQDPIKVVLELYRICKDNALISIKSPHFSCNWTHPGHKSAVGLAFFDHLSAQNPEHYGDCNFEVEYRKLHWIRPRYINSLLKRILCSFVDWLAGLNLHFCERIWCYWVGGFEEIEFRVKVKK